MFFRHKTVVYLKCTKLSAISVEEFVCVLRKLGPVYVESLAKLRKLS